MHWLFDLGPCFGIFFEVYWSAELLYVSRRRHNYELIIGGKKFFLCASKYFYSTIFLTPFLTYRGRFIILTLDFVLFFCDKVVFSKCFYCVKYLYLCVLVTVIILWNFYLLFSSVAFQNLVVTCFCYSPKKCFLCSSVVFSFILWKVYIKLL